jgi:hypothetical protein
MAMSLPGAVNTLTDSLTRDAKGRNGSVVSWGRRAIEM